MNPAVINSYFNILESQMMSNSDASAALTEFERTLLKVLERMEIRGKKGQTVPILYFC